MGTVLLIATLGLGSIRAAPQAGGPSNDTLLAGLSSSDAREREYAAWSLATFGNESAVAPLTGALRDPDMWVRLTAAWTLSEISPVASQSTYGELLISDSDSEVQRFVMGALEQKYDSASRELLMRVVREHPDADIRSRALMLLDENFEPELLEFFKSVAEGGDDLLKIKALPVLAKHRFLSDDDELLPVFASFVSHADPRVRREAIRGLRGVEDDRVFGLLEQAAGDPDAGVRNEALGAFSRVVDSLSLSTLLELYDAADAEGRQAIADSLVLVDPMDRDDWEVIEPVIQKAVGDPAPQPRRMMMRRLHRGACPLAPCPRYGGGEGWREYLEAGANDEDPEVRVEAGKGLAAYPSGSLEALGRLARDPVDEVRYGVLEALVERGGPGGVDIFIELAADADVRFRLLAIQGIARSGAGDLSVARLHDLLDDLAAEVRAEALRKLRWIAAEQSATVAACEAALADVAPEVRAAAAESLGYIRPRGWIDRVGGLLADPSALTRRAAAIALAYNWDEEMIPYVGDALDDPDARVREAAASFFFHVPDPTVAPRLRELWENDADPSVRLYAEHALVEMGTIDASERRVFRGDPGELPPELGVLFDFFAAVPGKRIGPPNMALFGLFEYAEALTGAGAAPFGNSFTLERDDDGRIFLTAWGSRDEVIPDGRFRADPTIPGFRYLEFFSAEDGSLNRLVWSRFNKSETRAVYTFEMADNGRDVVSSSISETLMTSNPQIEALRAAVGDSDRLAAMIEQMGLQEGPSRSIADGGRHLYRRGSQ